MKTAEHAHVTSFVPRRSTWPFHFGFVVSESTRTASALGEKYGYAIGRDAITNVFREFWPEHRRTRFAPPSHLAGPQVLSFRDLLYTRGPEREGRTISGPCRRISRMKITVKYVSRALLLALACLAISANARPQGQPDYSKTEIKATKVTENFYTLEGQGGMIGILVGPDGVFMVDSQFAPLTDKIVAAVKQITNQPIRFMVNTHVHPDHTGGNENLGKMGVVILARDELRKRLDGWNSCRKRSGRASAHGRRGTAADHLRRQSHLPPGRGEYRADPHRARAHRWRHAGMVSEEQRHHDWRLLPFGRLPEHRPGQRWIAERHDRRAQLHHQHRRSGHQNYSRPWHYGEQGGSDRASRHDRGHS